MCLNNIHLLILTGNELNSLIIFTNYLNGLKGCTNVMIKHRKLFTEFRYNNDWIITHLLYGIIIFFPYNIILLLVVL